MSDVERAEALKRVDKQIQSLDKTVIGMAHHKNPDIFMGRNTWERELSFWKTIRAALQPPALDCTVCKDDPIECGALPSLRHCPSAALDAEGGALEDIAFVRRNISDQWINAKGRKNIEKLHEAINRIEAALSVPAWRDISTAPRDRTRIRVATIEKRWRFDGEYFTDKDGHEFLPELIVKWDDSSVYAPSSKNYNGKGDAWIMDQFSQDGEYNRFPTVENPTHWMPLLPAPSSEGGT